MRHPHSELVLYGDGTWVQWQCPPPPPSAPDHLAMSGDTFHCHSLGDGMLLISSGQDAANILQETRKRPATKNGQ